MLIGVTMFYEVAFIIIVPIAFTLVRVTGVNLLWVGLPMSISLSTMHSFLPPHPGPTAVAATFHASVGHTLFYGLFIAVPAVRSSRCCGAAAVREGDEPLHTQGPGQ